MCKIKYESIWWTHLYVSSMGKKSERRYFCRKKNPWKYVSCLKIFSIRSHYAGEEGEKLANSPSASSLHPNIFLSPTVNLSSNPMSPSFKISFTSGQQLLPQCNGSLPHGLWQPSPKWSPLSPLASVVTELETEAKASCTYSHIDALPLTHTCPCWPTRV